MAANVSNVAVTCATTVTWTWVSGSSTVNAKGNYGTLGIASASNAPGARYGANAWTDTAAKIIEVIGQLYSLYKGTEALAVAARLARRQEHSRPVIESIQALMLAQLHTVNAKLRAQYSGRSGREGPGIVRHVAALPFWMAQARIAPLLPGFGYRPAVVRRTSVHEVRTESLQLCFVNGVFVA